MKIFPWCLLPLAVACSTDSDRPNPIIHPDAGPDAAVINTDAGVISDAGAPQDTGVLDAGGLSDASVSNDGGASGPIQADPLTWTWVPVPESRCINNSPTGFGVNLNPESNKLLIFMMGGNACFNVGSCLITANVDGYDERKFARERASLNTSSFDRTAEQNYFRDWSFAYFPYCSGDVFSGTIGRTEIEGSTYTFTGFLNVGFFLDRILATLPNVTEVVLAGVSAGGFGANVNYDRTARAFGPNVRVTLLNDSGPPMGNEYLAPCLQDHFRTVWGMDEGPLAVCPGCKQPDGSWVEPFLRHVLTTYPDRNFALISSAQDETIRAFWGFGNNECRDLLPGTSLPQYTGARFQAGLEDIRNRMDMDFDNFKLYMPNGTRHVWINSPPWNTTHHGVNLGDWIRAAHEDDETWDHAPVIE